MDSGEQHRWYRTPGPTGLAWTNYSESVPETGSDIWRWWGGVDWEEPGALGSIRAVETL